jgi:putative transposase
MQHLAGHYYHVYNRGCNREPIFAHDGDYRFLLQQAKKFLPDYPLRVIAYCLMPNHYHFLLCPEQDHVLSRFIQRLFNSYTQGFNQQQGRSGTLFEPREYESFVLSKVEPELEEHLQTFYLD